jgi:hypothetical protein
MRRQDLLQAGSWGENDDDERLLLSQQVSRVTDDHSTCNVFLRFVLLLLSTVSSGGVPIQEQRACSTSHKDTAQSSIPSTGSSSRRELGVHKPREKSAVNSILKSTATTCTATAETAAAHQLSCQQPQGCLRHTTAIRASTSRPPATYHTHVSLRCGW